MRKLKRYRVSKKLKLSEPTLMESYKTNYVPRCGTGLKVTINIMNNQWQLGILAYILKNQI